MPVLLLDFDGVLLRKHPIHDMVAMRCKFYAQRHINVRNPEKISLINRELYDSYGHTVLGLRALGYHAALEDFNHFVYSNIDLKSLYNIKDTHRRNIKEIRELLARVKDLDQRVDVRLFSNAPDVWCQTVLQLMGLDTIEKINTFGHLKPEAGAYDLVERTFPTADKFIFVDDKLINLKGVFARSTWEKVFYTGSDVTDIPHHELPHMIILNQLSSLPATSAFTGKTEPEAKNTQKDTHVIVGGTDMHANADSNANANANANAQCIPMFTKI